MQRSERYTKVAAILHWLIAVMMIGLVIMGFTFDLMPREMKPTAYMLHKSFGLTVLMLTFVRIWWRLSHPVPPLPESLKPLEVRAARAVHFCFYFLMLAMPMTGWVMSSAFGKYPTVYFGLFEIPHIPFPEGSKKAISYNSNQAHEMLGTIVVPALIALHFIGALKHQFIDKLPFIQRMCPRCKS